ncbi:MAG: 3-deoxy-8-phosphooctulonate synthase [Parachlamydiaceae bacterium]|nr:3-deoxy-8-phosphooctulonate synthase [Parachlamydiaceae bacterium]
MKKISIKNFFIGKDEPLVIMSGPCVIESEDHCLRAAEYLKKMFIKHDVKLIFKSSFDKANRSSFHSFRGPGLEEGLRILQKVKEEFDLPIVTDIHQSTDAKPVAEVCEILQIPAFLCRQTDLVVAAAQTGAIINVKKGQFLAPWDMKNVVSKIEEAGNQRIILTDRGTTFGYNNLVSDMRSIPIMQELLNYPVCYDATHSVQKPGGLGTSSGGDQKYIRHLAQAALGAGANLLFIESHPDPKNAKSDAASVMDFEELNSLIPIFKRLHEIVQSS